MLNSEKNILVVYVQKKLKKFCTTHKKSFATLGKTKAPLSSFHAKWSVPYAYMYDIFENCL
jgi:hypothetical protein